MRVSYWTSEEAIRLLTKCSLSAPNLFGESSSITEKSYEALGAALIESGRQTEAYPYYLKIFAIRDKQNSSVTSHLEKLFVQEGHRYTSLKRHKEAIALCEMALKRREDQLGKNHIKNANLVGHLREAVQAAGDSNRAAALGRRIEQLKATGIKD